MERSSYGIEGNMEQIIKCDLPYLGSKTVDFERVRKKDRNGLRTLAWRSQNWLGEAMK